MDKRAKKFEVPSQIAKLNTAVEVLAKMDFQDMAQVRKTVEKIRWDLAQVNLDLCQLINET